MKPLPENVPPETALTLVCCTIGILPADYLLKGVCIRSREERTFETKGAYSNPRIESRNHL
jgi:hypothetical protein